MSPPNRLLISRAGRRSSQGAGFTSREFTADNLDGVFTLRTTTHRSDLGFRPCFTSQGSESIGDFSIPSIGQTGYVPPAQSFPDIQKAIFLSERWQPMTVPPAGMSAFLAGTDAGAVIADGGLFDRTSPDWLQLGMFFSPIPLIGNYFMLFFGATEDPDPTFVHGLIPFGWSTQFIPAIKTGSIDKIEPHQTFNRAHSAGRRVYRMGVGPPLYAMSAIRAYCTDAASVGVYSPPDTSRTPLADIFWARAVASGFAKVDAQGRNILRAQDVVRTPLVVGLPGNSPGIDAQKLNVLSHVMFAVSPDINRARAEMLSRSFHVMNARACGYVQQMLQQFGTAADLDLYRSRPEVQAAMNGQRLAGMNRRALKHLPPPSARTQQILSGLRFG